MIVVQLRGNSGSGKTTVVRKALAQWPFTAIRDPYLDPTLAGKRRRDPIAYCSTGELPLIVLGSYEPTCGGCDTIPTQDEIALRIRRYLAEGYHVLFEGLLASELRRYEVLAAELQVTGHQYVHVFLDTPLALCLARVVERRQTRGDTRPFNPANTTRRHEVITRARVRAEAAGLAVQRLSSEDAWPYILRLLDATTRHA